MKKLFGVIGDPIEHSMSPVMHNDLFKHYEIDAEMFPFHIKKENLKEAVMGFRAINLAGFNITVPHKTTIMCYLDEIDPLAKAIGAVNTVVNRDGRLIGYNTDGSGYLEGLLSELTSIQEKKTLIIGAGGAAKGLYYSMAQVGVKYIDIANRTTQLAENLIENCPYPTISEVLKLQNAKEYLPKYDLIIQTTPMGMKTDPDSSPLYLENLKEDVFVSDIIYTPLETKFLRNARKQGARTQNGMPMFVYQGALAFEKWTGIFPDTKRMESVVLKQLGGEIC